MSKIKGMTVTLFVRNQTGVDAFNAPIYSERAVDVENVLVSPASSTDVTDALNLTGRKAVYTLGIPKEDAHSWEGCKVRFFGQDWRVITIQQEGIAGNLPRRLPWNRKVLVERYE